jgi:hypothetical protein
MVKNLNGGAQISYGAVLPPVTSVPDGSLFYKTDSTGVPAGLYMLGFIRDTTSGYQITQHWVQATSPEAFVAKAGDTMTGALTVPHSITITQSNGDGLNNPGVISSFAGIIKLGNGSTWSGFGGDVNNFLSINTRDPRGGLQFLSAQVWTEHNQGPDSGLDADTVDGVHAVQLQNMAVGKTGILSVLNGGTGTDLPASPGGVIYSLTESRYASTSVGLPGQILFSRGVQSPVWESPASLSVGSATMANSANSAITAQTANTANTALSVLWAAITDIQSAKQTFSGSNVGSLVYATPALFHDFGLLSAVAPVPSKFSVGGVSGFDSASATDIERRSVGITVSGLNGSSAQLILNKNSASFRSNDQALGQDAWGETRTFWDNVNLKNISQLANDVQFISTGEVQNTYAKKSGDTFSGPVLINSTLDVGDVRSTGVVSGSTVSTNTGDTGHVNLHSGTVNTGYVEFVGQNGVRAALIGNATSSALDKGNLLYAAGAHSFSGAVISDYEVRTLADSAAFKNVAEITDAVQKVKTLTGVTFERNVDAVRGAGLIAQNVLDILPEAVKTDQSGLMSVAYGSLTGLLVQAIKAQQDQIDSLQQQITALQNPP